jgi:polysaccharide biosynthesis/export protein
MSAGAGLGGSGLAPAWLRTLLACAALFAATASAQERQPEYQLGSGDSIRITVFQNPDLTVETRVTENGTISYPLVGAVRIGGLTIPAAEQAVARALREGNYIQQPQVNITLLQNRGNQVSVLGSVTRPGRFPLETFDIRLSEMLAIAGGIAPTGADVIILTGTRDGKPIRREIDVAGMFLDDRLERDVVVAGGDVIYVPTQPLYYVYGLVQRPGSFRIERGMTVRQALAQAGGPTTRGTERGLRIFRRAAGGDIESLNPALGDAVKPNDVLYVQQSIF